jgi:hypothetical protein
MSHDTHDTHHEHSESHHSQAEAHGHADAHGHDHHHGHGHNTPGSEEISKQSRISFKNAFWLIIIIVGLFISALNFIQAESGPTEDHAPTRYIMETGSGHTGKGAMHEEMQAEHEAAADAHAAGADSSTHPHESGTRVSDHTPEAAPAEHAAEAGH